MPDTSIIYVITVRCKNSQRHCISTISVIIKATGDRSNLTKYRIAPCTYCSIVCS